MIHTILKTLCITTCLLMTVPVVLAGEDQPEQAEKEASNAKVQGDIEAARTGWALLEEGALLIDVRSAEEFDGGTIKGSLNIVHTDINGLARAIGTGTDRKVVLYCGSGRRADLAKDQLEALGYTGIYNASGYEALLVTRP